MRNTLIFACLATTWLVAPSSALVAPPSATRYSRTPSRGSGFAGVDLSPPSASKYPAATAARITHRRDRSRLHAASFTRGAVAGRVPWRKLWLNRKQWERLVRKQIGIFCDIVTSTDRLMPASLRRVFTMTREHTHYLDLLPIGILAVFASRFGRFLYNRFLHKLRPGKDYEHSITRQVCERTRQASGLALVCYAVDILEIVLEVAGIKGSKVDMSKRISGLLYATWGAAVVRDYKSGVIEAFVKKTARSRRGAKDLVLVYEKLSDFFLILVLVTLYGNMLNVKFGSGAFALGSAGTLVISLSIQDILKRMVNGLMLSASDSFTVGDSILLGDGTSGTVTRMRWLETEIRGMSPGLLCPCEAGSNLHVLSQEWTS